MNWLDLVAVVVMALAIMVGFRAGATRQIAGLLGGLLGLLLSIAAAVLMSDVLFPIDPLARGILLIGSFAVAFVVGRAVGGALGQRVLAGDAPGPAGTVNRIGGALFTAVEAIVLLWLMAALLLVGPRPEWARLAQESATMTTLIEAGPAPSVLAQGLSQGSWTDEALDLFEGFNQAIAQPSVLPSSRDARALAKRTQDSVVMIRAQACDQVQQGSGAAVATGYVITNAHVVAGSDPVQIDHGGQVFDGVVVAFDSSQDLALIKAEGLPANPLPVSLSDPERGAKGIVMGFPGGAALTAVPASVNRGVPVFAEERGTDRPITGITRDVLELNARVSPGDSGGPFVLQDGTLGGVVFAESPTDAKIGYAVAASHIETMLRRALGATQAVPVGPCQ